LCWWVCHKSPVLLKLNGPSKVFGIKLVVVEKIVPPCLVLGERWAYWPGGSLSRRSNLWRVVIYEIGEVKSSCSTGWLLVMSKTRLSRPDGRFWRISIIILLPEVDGSLGSRSFIVGYQVDDNLLSWLVWCSRKVRGLLRLGLGHTVHDHSCKIDARVC
jgi:hypothetical protein